ncbi:class I SAM-dependent methyltransferase [Streptomyces sp. NPDC046866]|uniref:class I SAM-dependent methyltransferase n=1 Tax=Streptomyces sp. NPDC046866 TaxID=3154921 RepID=UPI003456F640
MAPREQLEIDPRRSRVFGEVAELYDATRPGYPEPLVREVLAYAALGRRAALEVGAGTGKATVPFAAAGTPLVCIEPDERMADVLRRNTASSPQVQVEVGPFEDWLPSESRSFGLLLAATSWHWLDPERRWDLVHGALAPGGAVALFWNLQGVRDAELHAALAEVDRRHGMANAPHGEPASSFGDVPGNGGAVPGSWPDAECRRDGRFTDLRAHRFRREHHWATDRYVGHLASLSHYRVLAAEQRERLLAGTARVLDAHGGGIAMEQISDLFLARTR